MAAEESLAKLQREIAEAALSSRFSSIEYKPKDKQKRQTRACQLVHLRYGGQTPAVFRDLVLCANGNAKG